ncbi:MAG TPA: copper resistance CopC family protein [Rhizomicrobium sp.]|nr:copper resistance CopC family protein [Rhizomicrobium sp.]
MKQTLLVAALIAGLAGPALAHAFLDKASPAAGENLKTPPSAVTLQFTEALEPAFSAVAVTDEAGHDVTAGAPTINGTQMMVALKHLLPGRYRVSWHAVSVDTHRTQGKYGFLVLP